MSGSCSWLTMNDWITEENIYALSCRKGAAFNLDEYADDVITITIDDNVH